ncbi:MAG: ABC transporter permease, partial [Anaerolineae bacterium]|nr:ABC transporter permease [Anaerolineae bacterium]
MDHRGHGFQPYQYPMVPGAPPPILGENMLFAAPEDVVVITGLDGFNLLLSRYTAFEAAQANVPTLERVLSEQTPYLPFLSLQDDPENNSFVQQTRTFSNVFALLAYIALLVSGFLVFNVVNAIINEQRRQIGIMKSLGAREEDTFFIYTGMALVYGVIGVVPGVLLGIPAGFVLAEGLAPQFNIFIDAFMLSRDGILLGMVMGLLVPVLAAFIPVLSGMRVTILEAITDLGIDASYRLGPLARLVDLLPLPMNIRQAFRNTLQKKGRLALTMITLSLAAGSFMGIYAMIVSLNAITDNIFDTFGQQITAVPNDQQDFEDLRQLLVEAQVPGIRSVERGTWVAVSIEGYTPQAIGTSPPVLYSFGFDYASYPIINFNLREGTAWEDDPNREGVVITAGVADSMDKSVGDTVRVNAGSTQREYEIIGVSTYPFDSIWFTWDELAWLGGQVRGARGPNDYVATLALTNDAAAAPTSTPAVGINAGALPFLQIAEGTPLEFGADEVMITSELAERDGLAVGDTVTLQGADRAESFTVSAIFSLPATLQQPDQPAELVALDFERLVALEGVSLDGEPISNTLEVIMAAEDPNAAAVADQISQINEVFLANGINANFTNWQENAELIGQLIVTAGFVLNIAATLIGLVGAIGLLSTLSMGVFERQKEIGVMRSVGAPSSAIALQFLTEGWIVGVIAWVIGLPISYYLNLILISAFDFQNIPGVQY